MTEALRVKILLTICAGVLAIAGYAGAQYHHRVAVEKARQEEINQYHRDVETARKATPRVGMDFTNFHRSSAEALRVQPKAK